MSLSQVSPESAAGPDALFTRAGDLFAPTRHARGYWLPGTLNGAAMASLLAFVLEDRHGEAGWVPARYVVDMLGMPRAEPLAVTSRVIKAGGRLRLVEAEIMQDGRLMARASLQLLRPTQAPANPTWQSPRWNAPNPEAVPAAQWGNAWELRPLPPEAARIARTAPAGIDPERSNRPVLGVLNPVTERQAWLRVHREIVAGEPLTPFGRLAMAGDFASPLAHSNDAGIDYVNTDFTIYLHRLPQGEWLGFEMVGHSSTNGVAVGECWVHDAAGPLGTINTTALAQIRKV